MAVIAVGAHPDDIELGCYASLARFKEEVTFIVMSAGELTGDKYGRVKEAQESASLIGAKVEVWQYPDSAIPLDKDIIGRLHTRIEQINPHTIFAPFEHDTHQDHRQVSQLVLAASNGVNRILLYELPSTKPSFIPNVFYNVTDSFALKLQAMRCHKSQAAKPYFNPAGIEGLAKYRAAQCKHYGMFEAFYGYRLVEV